MMHTFVSWNYFQKIRKCWLYNVREIVDDTLGLKKLWLRPGTAKKGCEIKKVVNNLKYLYKSQWNRNGNHSKLRTYNKLKVFLEVSSRHT